MATDYTADANCHGAWLFADNLNDASGDGNTLTAGGSPAYSTDVPTGYTTGKSVDFNRATPDTLYRTHANLSAGFPGQAAMQDFAYAFWAKWDLLAAGNYYAVMSKFNGFFCLHETTTKFRHFQYDSGWASAYTDMNALSTATWYHIVISFNGNGTDTVRTAWISTESSFGDVLNGGTDTMTGVGDLMADASAQFTIGARAASTYPFDGHVYQPIVFNRTISAAEAEEMYTNGINGAEGAVGNPYYAYAQQ